MLKLVNWYLCQKENNLILRQKDWLQNSKLISSNKLKLKRKKKEKGKLKAFKKLQTIGRQLLKIFVQLSKPSKRIMLINNKRKNKETLIRKKK